MRVSTVFLCSTILAFSLGTAASTARERASETPAVQMRIPVVHYRTENIAGTDIFYREAGPADAPTLVLMHGFPTSSHMFRNLIPLLADRYHVIAPDYPGFGESAAPDHDKFEYTFGHITDLMDGLLQKKSVKRYVLYAMDYGAPISYRLAVLHPERVSGLIIQNGNAYDEGLKAFWDPIKAYWADGSTANREALSKLVTLPTTKFQYTDGMSDVTRIDPDNWRTISRCWTGPATRTSSWIFSTTTGQTSQCIRNSRNSSARRSRRRSLSGERTTRYFRPTARSPICETCRTPSCI
jgi:pimeloyl-ACP methyl ester carboxylesterase